MKIKNIQLVPLFLLSGIFLSCATTSQFRPGYGSKYQYTYTMIYPAKNSKLLFQDDSVIIQFKFDDAAIQFQLQNISDAPVTLDWDKASLGINDRYFGVRHAANLYADTIRSNSIIMPPLGYLRDVIIPRENIYNDGDKWVEVDLLPTTDQRSLPRQEVIKKNVGQKISLLLPMMFGATIRNYKFDFQVDAVRQVAWKDFTPVKRVPAPPKIVHTGLDNVTTAIIVVGVLGFSAYALSVKKNPASE